MLPKIEIEGISDHPMKSVDYINAHRKVVPDLDSKILEFERKQE